MALQQVLANWNSYFKSIKKFSLWYLPIEDERTGKLYVALIHFHNTEDLNSFIKNTSLRLYTPSDRNLIKGKLGWKLGEHDLLFMDDTGILESVDSYVSAFINS